MSYFRKIQDVQDSAELLENLHSESVRTGQEADFRQDLLMAYKQDRDNLLLQAWYYRLKEPPEAVKPARQPINWKLAIPFSILNGLLLWGLAELETARLTVFQANLPFLFWAPVTAIVVITFLVLTRRKSLRLSLAVCAGLVGLSIYVYLMVLRNPLASPDQFLTLMIVHMPLLAWIAVGISLLGFGSSALRRFAFLNKSLDIVITAGLYVIAGVIFTLITTQLFQALEITLPAWIMRLIVAGGGGLIPVLAIATGYELRAEPEDQDRQHGLSRVVANLMQVLLPLALIVLAIYLVFIPFNFWKPFENRDVLIVYNVLLFAIMGLLIGATPIQAEDVPPGQQSLLRSAFLGLAALTVIVSLYAMSATVSRTIAGGLTMNRLTIIGWNTINISILALMIYRMLKEGKARWIAGLHQAFKVASLGYVAWCIVILMGVPWLFF